MVLKNISLTLIAAGVLFAQTTQEYGNRNLRGYNDIKCGTAPSNPASGDVRFYCDSGTGDLGCKDSSGGNCLPSGGGGGATNASQLYDFQTTKTSGTVLTINQNCSSSLPCVARWGSVASRLTTSSTVTISAGTGLAYIYLDTSSGIIAGHNGLTLVCSGCTVQSGITQFPSDSIPLYTWNAVSAVWDASGTDYRAFISNKRVAQGSGITVTESSGHATIAVDTAVVGLRVAVPGASTTPCVSGSWAADATYFYICHATDTWRRVATSTW